MKVKLIKASDYTFEEYININSLQDLINLEDKYKCGLIIDISCERPSIIIYDDYIE